LVIGAGAVAVVLAARRATVTWLVAAASVMAVISLLGAIQPGPDYLRPVFGARYSFVPEVLFGWAFVALAVESRAPLAPLAVVLVAWRIAVGAAGYVLPTPALPTRSRPSAIHSDAVEC
jgi:peptidoglycan/LPS O-acetylase OafA/YrhL